MAVQEFMLEEMKDVAENAEKGEEWKGLVEELNLEGQRQLCNSDPASPIPFTNMNKEMIRVYETLCPVKRLLKDYNKTAIPIRVLEIAGFCILKEYFGKIEVWYDDEEPDPIIVGCDGEDKYILARWAAELEEYAVLKKKAMDRKVKKITLDLQLHQREVAAGLENVVEHTARWMSGDWVHEGVSW